MAHYTIPQDAIITVAGVVGVGKSTFTTALAQKLKFQPSLEKVQDNPYFERYYQDFERWSFNFQIACLVDRFKEQKRMFEQPGGFVQDRSIYEDVNIFAKMHYDNQAMTQADYQTIYNLFEAMVLTPHFPKADILIYLQCDLDEMLARIRQRGRLMELETDMSYWKDLHQRYEQWINQFTGCPIIRININEYDIKQSPDTLDPIIDKIAQKIERK